MIFELGQILEQSSEPAVAVRAYEQCLPIMQRCYAITDLVYVNLLVTIAAVREAAEDLSGAVMMREHADSILRANSPLDEDRAEQRDVNKASLDSLKRRLT